MARPLHFERIRNYIRVEKNMIVVRARPGSRRREHGPGLLFRVP